MYVAKYKTSNFQNTAYVHFRRVRFITKVEMAENKNIYNKITWYFSQNLPTHPYSPQESNDPPLGHRENFCPTTTGNSSHDLIQTQKLLQEQPKNASSSEQRCETSPGNRSLELAKPLPLSAPAAQSNSMPA